MVAVVYASVDEYVQDLEGENYLKYDSPEAVWLSVCISNIRTVQPHMMEERIGSLSVAADAASDVSATVVPQTMPVIC